MASAEAAPVTPDEAVTLFAGLRHRAGVALAVSGGADSLALLHLYLAARRLDGDLPAATVLTVDHALRPASADEAARVAAIARDLGLPHRRLVWEGTKPTGDLQAAARRARRRLLFAAAREAGLDTLAFAHHADDQAETFLLRLARGSGVVGLAAMAAVREEAGLRVVRPFLDLPKARLTATLRALGVDWIEDPSNADPRFDRARLRAAMPDLAALGLTRARLTATAAAMARAGAVLEDLVGDLAGRAVSVHPAGWMVVDPGVVAAAGEEIRLRLLSRIVAAIGGRDHGPRLEACVGLDRDLVRATATTPTVRTLGGARIELRRGRVWFAPEAGRQGDGLDLAPGTRGSWCGRLVELPAAAAGGCRVAMLGPAGRRALTGRGCLSPDVLGRPAPSAAVIETAAAVFVGDRLIACPGLGLRHPDGDGPVIAPLRLAGAGEAVTNSA